MPTVIKNFNFGEVSNDLVDQANAANITASQNTTEPSIAFTCTANNILETEYGLYQDGDTWEDWGVPSGATVNSVSAEWTDRTADNSRLTTHSVDLDIMQTDGTTTCLDAVLATKDLSVAIEGTFNTNTGSVINVSTGSQSSTTVVRLRASYNLDTANGKNPSVDWRLGDVDILIDYTEASGADRRIFIVL